MIADEGTPALIGGAMPEDAHPPSSLILSRRTLLALAGGGALATALAACGVGDPEPSPSATREAWTP